MKRTIEYFTDHTMDSESLRLAEHEVLLSFYNDGGAYAFDDWWHTQGKKAYEDWCAGQLESLSESYG